MLPPLFATRFGFIIPSLMLNPWEHFEALSLRLLPMRLFGLYLLMVCCGACCFHFVSAATHVACGISGGTKQQRDRPFLVVSR